MTRIFVDTEELAAMSQRARLQAQRLGEVNLTLLRATNQRLQSSRGAAATAEAAALRQKVSSIGARLEEISAKLRQQSASVLATQRAFTPHSALRAGPIRAVASWSDAGATRSGNAGAGFGSVRSASWGTPSLLQGVLAGMPYNDLNGWALRTSMAIGVQNALRGRTSLFSGGTMPQFNQTFHNNVVHRFGGGSLTLGSQVNWALGLLRQAQSRPTSSRPVSGLFNGVFRSLNPTQSIFTHNAPRNSVGAFLTRPSGLGGSF